MQIRDSDDETIEEQENVEDEDIVIVGDSIGDTAYSQRFVIKCLMGLATSDRVKQLDFLDEELCLLWDMATDKHVVLFLADHGAVSLLLQSLARTIISDDNRDEHKDVDEETKSRLIEILIGILTNMCCFPEGMQAVTVESDNITQILENVQSEDSRILLQVFRFVFNCVYHDADRFSTWLDHLSECGFADAATFVLCNSTNCELLKQTFETINCLCSAQEERPDDDRFSKLFKNRNVIEHSVTGLKEICGLSEEDEAAYERIEILFVSIHSTLYKVLSRCDDKQYVDNVSVLFKSVNEILIRNVKEKTDNLDDMICYLTKIFILDRPPVCGEVDTLFDISLSHLENVLKSASEFEDTTETVDSLTGFLLTIMASSDNDRLISYRKKLNTQVANALVTKLQEKNAPALSKYKNVMNILKSD